jgi:hypothetical protein
MLMPKFSFEQLMRIFGSGGGRRINFTSDNGVPSRWMAYEAMLAGLEMTPFHENFAEQDLTGRPPTTSMTGFYKFFEYVPLISWADPSVSPVDNASVPKFTRCDTFSCFSNSRRTDVRQVHVIVLALGKSTTIKNCHVSVGLLDSMFIPIATPSPIFPMLGGLLAGVKYANCCELHPRLLMTRYPYSVTRER